MSPNMIKKAQIILLDTIGVILAATSLNYSAGRILTQFVKEQGGEPECTLMGRNFKTSCVQACLVNSTMGYYCDNEAHHPGAILHPAAVAIPTSLAFAEREGLTGKDLLAAMVLGIEVSCRVSYAINPQALYEKGLHPTSICCGFGAFAIGAYLMDLELEQIINGLGLVGNQASGLLAWASDKTENSRPFNPGIAARNGATAALLSQLGFGGPTSIFHGEYNLFKAFSHGEERKEELFFPQWRFNELAIKLYSSCSFTHPGLDGLLQLMKEYQLSARNIKKIILRYPASGVHMIHNHALKSHNAQYVMAVAAVKGNILMDDILHDRLSHPEIQRLSENMELIGDEELEKNYPDQYESIVELETDDGRTLKKHIDWPKGSIQNPLTEEEIKEKFIKNATTVIPQERAYQIIDWVSDAPEKKNLDDLCKLLQE